MFAGKSYGNTLTLLLGLLSLAFVTPGMIAHKTANTNSFTKDGAQNDRIAAWDDANLEPSLTFNIDVSKSIAKGTHTVFKKLRVRNKSSEDTTYSITSKFWNDAMSSDIVSVASVFPGKVKVDAGMERTISVVMTFRGDLLPLDFSLNSAQEDATVSGRLTSLSDYDGYLVIDDSIEPVQVPWHIVCNDIEKLELMDRWTEVKQ